MSQREMVRPGLKGDICLIKTKAREDTLECVFGDQSSALQARQSGVTDFY